MNSDEEVRSTTLAGHKLLVTGGTGNVGARVATALVSSNEVWVAARLSDEAVRERLTAAGVHCCKVDLVDGDVRGVPDDIDYVLNFGVVETRDWDTDLDGNVNGVLAVMDRCRSAKALVHCSTTAVYQASSAGGAVYAEGAELGDNHRVWPRKNTYSISKIAAEAAARFVARQRGIPTTIARLNVPYGETVGGWPAAHLRRIVAGEPIDVHPGGNTYNPIHEDDIIGTLPGLVAAASTQPTVVNWGGVDAVSIEEWCTYLGELVGRQPRFRSTTDTIAGISTDLTRMLELVGSTSVPWREGMRRVVDAHLPAIERAQEMGR